MDPFSTLFGHLMGRPVYKDPFRLSSEEIIDFNKWKASFDEIITSCNQNLESYSQSITNRHAAIINSPEHAANTFKNHLANHKLDEAMECLKDYPDSLMDRLVLEDAKHQTLLHLLAWKNRKESLLEILNNDQIDRMKLLSMQDIDGWTVLHILAHNQQTETIQQLLKLEHIQKETLLNIKDIIGKTVDQKLKILGINITD